MTHSRKELQSNYSATLDAERADTHRSIDTGSESSQRSERDSSGATKNSPARVLLGLLWLPLAVAIAVACLEGVFALAQVGEEDSIKYVPILGYFHFENKRITFRSEGFSEDKINSRGFRDRERSIAKPQGVTRIAVLGDSRTEAFQVPLEDNFCALLEKRLEQAYPGRFEVMNCGMTNFSTGQEYLLYLNKVAEYKPDICILGYHAMDAQENQVPIGCDNPTPRPFFFLDDRNQLQISWDSLQKWWNADTARHYRFIEPLRKCSHVFGVYTQMDLLLSGDKFFGKVSKIIGSSARPLWNAYVGSLPADKIEYPTLSDLDPSIPTTEDGVTTSDTPYTKVAIPPVTATDQEVALGQQVYRLSVATWPVTAAIFHYLNRACNANDCKLVVAALPEPNQALFYRKEVERIASQSQTDGFKFIDVKNEKTVGSLEDSPMYLHKGHYSRHGHRVIADILFEGLQSDGLIPSRAESKEKN